MRFDSDDIIDALHWAIENNEMETAVLILESVSEDLQGRSKSCRLSALEVAVSYAHEDMAIMLLEKGAEPLASPCRLGTLPQLAVQAGMEGFLQRLQQKLENSGKQADAFHEIRRAIEGRSVTCWKLLEPNLKSVLNVTDQDQWSLALLLYQAKYPFPGTEKNSSEELSSKENPLPPTRLTFPELWNTSPGEEETVNFDSTGGEVWQDDKGALTVRADHPLLPRGFGGGYFELKMLKCPIRVATESSWVVIGLCGGFSDLWEAVPGWRKFSVGYHNDNGCAYEDIAAEDSDQIDLGQKYGEGDVVGCGVDWQSESCYFTYNGKLLGEIKGKNTLLKLYPAVGLAHPCRVQVNFGNRPFMYTPTELSRHIQRISDSDIPDILA